MKLHRYISPFVAGFNLGTLYYLQMIFFCTETCRSSASATTYVYLMMCILLVPLTGTLISSAGNGQLEKFLSQF